MLEVMVDFSTIREEYRHARLDESAVSPDPIDQFRIWFDDALRSALREANAMALATSTREGVPSVRIVLLKGFDARGFVFFTNYDSGKGRELAQNARVSLCFYWKDLERQIRISGEAVMTTRGESVEYFNSRPVGSRISAAASAQSAVLGSRYELEAATAALQAEYPNGDVPCPENWGGYRVVPDEIEFWQGRENRLHDRIRYRRQGDAWITERLAP